MIERDTPKKRINVTGMFIGLYIDNGQPVLFELESKLFLPIFSTPEKYEAAMRSSHGPTLPTKIQQITNHPEFLDSVIGKVRLMLDPWTTDMGTTRWTDLRAESVEDEKP